MTNASPSAATSTHATPRTIDALPRWSVLLHDDDINTVEYVAKAIVTLTPLAAQEAFTCTIEAHEKGVSLLLTTHRERAELVQEQLVSSGLTVTIEPC